MSGNCRRNLASRYILPLPCGWRCRPPRRGNRAENERKMSYDINSISHAVQKSLSFAQVLREIGKRGSGTQQRIKLFCQRNNIDYSHFTGQAHRTPQPKVSFENGSKKVSTAILKKRLFSSGVKKVCQSCGISEWRGVQAPLELHHIDGNRNNNDISNLQILCPNCHAQTESYCKRKTKRKE